MSFMPVFEAQRSFKPEKPVFDRLYMDASKRSQVLAAKMQISQVVPPECTFVPEVSHSKIVQRSKGKNERSNDQVKEGRSNNVNVLPQKSPFSPSGALSPYLQRSK